MKINIFWYRRDLRLDDNHGLFHALQSGNPVLLLFIFDTNIIDELDRKDMRINFIYDHLSSLNSQLQSFNSSILIKKGNPIKIWKDLINNNNIESIYLNKDYEPYAIQRDKEIEKLAKINNINYFSFKDQVVFEKDEIVKKDHKPYTVFSPYMKKWKHKFDTLNLDTYPSNNYLSNLYSVTFNFPKLVDIGFNRIHLKLPKINLSEAFLKTFHKTRDFPSLPTSNLSIYLRFGTISIREVINSVKNTSEIFLNELIWREFFMQILFHFPQVVSQNYKTKYDKIIWRNNDIEFKRWCNGETGYPIVDAGIKEMNQTGFMHNRVRMICASFLCKHLLIDWRWGEAYFAKKLLDYELSSNNGNWQWAASTGCDAVPYFRIFNPYEQQKKYDKNNSYIRKWNPEYLKNSYPKPIIEHKFARKRALDTYKKSLSS